MKSLAENARDFILYIAFVYKRLPWQRHTGPRMGNAAHNKKPVQPFSFMLTQCGYPLFGFKTFEYGQRFVNNMPSRAGGHIVVTIILQCNLSNPQ